MFNAYPDSCGGDLTALVNLLASDALASAFHHLYLLPSIYHSDLDRGFSVQSYEIDQEMGSQVDLDRISALGISLKLDLVLNHLSARSPEFLDVLERGDQSEFFDMFIDWNRFWEGHGVAGSDGCIVPEADSLERMFMRKPGLPVLRVASPDGTPRFFWNTFYQSIGVEQVDPTTIQSDLGVDPSQALMLHQALNDASNFGGAVDWERVDAGVAHDVQRRYLMIEGQVDLDARSDSVWNYYDRTIEQLATYGTKTLRLDAFAYLAKQPGERNFMNEPGTWECLARVKEIADRYHVDLLPEIHAPYRERTHERLAGHGYQFYDFFFPSLVIHAIESQNPQTLLSWMHEVIENGYRTVTMLGCHDGIPLLDLEGLLTAREIQNLIDLVQGRGGRVKNLFGPDGRKISYYQVNATYFSALGEDPKRLLLARALHMFMPGTPQVWYLDLFAGTNDYAAADAGGHKEINRTNLSSDRITEMLNEPVVSEQIDLIRLRTTHPAFAPPAKLDVAAGGAVLSIRWSSDTHKAALAVDFSQTSFEIEHS